MIFFIIKHIKAANKAVKLGNEYRSDKYGNKSHKVTKPDIPTTLSMFASEIELKQIDNFKAQYHYWDVWTGARFEREENPIYRTKAGKSITPNSVCIVNPVTGYWLPL